MTPLVVNCCAFSDTSTDALAGPCGGAMQCSASRSARYVPCTTEPFPPKRQRYSEPPRKLLPVTVTLVPPATGPRSRWRRDTTGSA